MGNPQESLNSFLRQMIQAPKDAKERARNSPPFNYEVNIHTARIDPMIPKVTVRGQTVELSTDPVIYEVPALGLLVATYGGRRHATGLSTSLQETLSHLGGHEVEMDTRFGRSNYVGPITNWNNWKNGIAGKEYRDKIYPYVKTLFEVGANSIEEGGIVQVDLFGGDGEFAQLVAEALPSRTNRSEIHIMDLNQSALTTAKEKLISDEKSDFIIHPPVNLATTRNIFQGIQNPPNLVTALGGLCEGIVTRNEARKIAANVYNGMSKGGMFIVSGYSPVLLNSTDFTNLGFKVAQMSVPANVLSFDSPYQMYVLRK